MSSTPRNILVFDVGSSALKAAIFDPSGVIIARAEADYAGGGAAHRQSPMDWWQAAVTAAREVGPEDVGAIALTGTMENLIPVAENGAPLGDAILYSDPCGAPYLEGLAAALEEADAVTICGNTLEPLMTAFKLQWLKQHDFNTWVGARWFLPGSKDFLALRLTGEAATDPTCAATTGLMDMATRDWSAPLRTIHGLERRRLPHIRPATEIIGQLTAVAAAELGLETGIPVVNGCGDGGTTTMGGGADSADDVSLYIGTTGWVARVAGSAALATRSQFYRLPHPVGDGIIEIAPILSAGAATDWARDALGVGIESAEILARQADVAPGDVVFLPYLSGERSPFLDLDVRGAFLGLSSGDGPPELYYAVLEGVAFAIDANLRAMGGERRRKVSLVGGGALSAIWPQIIADIIGAPVVAPADPVSATSFGAFRIAQRALRVPVAINSFAPLARPRQERAGRARRLRERYAKGTELVRGLV